MALTQIKSTLLAPQAVGWVKLSVTTASDSATYIDITSGFSATYDDYMIVIHHTVPATDETELNAQLYINGAVRTDSYYNFHLNRSNDDANTYAGTGDNEADKIFMLTSWGGETSEGCDGFFYVFNANEANAHQKVLFEMVYDGGGGAQNATSAKGVGTYHDDGVGAGNMVCAGVRFLTGSGNIASGDFILYGLSK